MDRTDEMRRGGPRSRGDRDFDPPAHEPDAQARKFGVRPAGWRFGPLADGRWREAADVWRAAGYRYEYAAALAETPEPDDKLAALAFLDARGAKPLAPNRPDPAQDPRRRQDPARSGNRRNPAGLTERQVEVVHLLATGMTNADIASHLVLSARTVEHHIAAAAENRASAPAPKRWPAPTTGILNA